MFHNYDYYAIQQLAIRQAALLQEAEQERLILAAQRDTPPFYHHWVYLLGHGMGKLFAQLLRFGEPDQDSAGARSPRHMPLQ